MQRSRVAAHLDASYGSFFQIEGRLATRLTYGGAQKLAQIGIVPNHHHRFLFSVLFQHSVEVRKARFGTKRRFNLQFAFVTHFISNQRSSLCGPLERTGNHAVHLRLDCGKGSTNVPTLLDAFFIERAFFVLLGIDEVLTGAGVS